MVCRKYFGRGIHPLMLIEEGSNIARELPVVCLPGGVQTSRSLFIGAAYFLPAERAGCDERRQLFLAPRNRNGLLVRAAVGLGNLTAPFGSQPRPQFDQSHARSGNPLPARPSRRRLGRNTACA